MKLYSPEEIASAKVDLALEELHRPVLDTQPGHPGNPRVIARYYIEVGAWWERYIEVYGNGTYKEVFVVDGDKRYMSWCGIFVGWCGLHVGEALEEERAMCVDVSIVPEVAQECLASTYRLEDRKKWDAIDVPQPERLFTRRRKGVRGRGDLDGIRRGDIVVVYSSRAKPYGDHITLALGPPDKDGRVETVSGNTYGAIPGFDKEMEGVALKTYEPKDVARVVRLVGGHYRGLVQK